MKSKLKLTLLGVLLLAGTGSAQPPIMGPSVNIQGTLPTRAHTLKGDARDARDSSRPAPPPPSSYSNSNSNASNSNAGKAPPIHRAAADGQVEAVKEALKKNPQSVRQTDSSGYSPLHHAAIGGHADVVEVLLENGAMIDGVGSRGETALLLAASAGNTEVVELLAEKGADVNRASADGKTPLQKAAMGGHADVVEILLKAGADPTVKDRSGRTAQDIAEHYRAGDSARIIRLLQKATQ